MSDIVVSNLKCGYDDKVVFDGFDITFEGGKINVVLGGSGVGKTTLLNVLAGIKQAEGSVEGVEGGVSYIFQKDRLIPSISVYKNLDLVIRRFFKDKNERKNMIESVLKQLEVFEVRDRLPDELSGGQQQRVAMARAFLYPASVMLLDEPFKALDTALKARLIKSFLTLAKEQNKTVVFVTHAIDECLLCADNYFVFDGNPVRTVFSGSIAIDKQDRALTDPRLDEVRRGLLDALVR